MKKLLVSLIAGIFIFSMVGIVQAAPITGDPVGNSFGWVPNSTNALNYDLLVPGRVGQVAPYVLFNSSDATSVTLDFFNFASSGIAFFEYKIDGNASGANAHPIVTGDTIHSGVYLANSASNIGRNFLATQYVDIRLALGGERDWDFDWTRFEVAQASPVPEPGTLLLIGSGLAGLALYRRRMNKV